MIRFVNGSVYGTGSFNLESVIPEFDTDFVRSRQGLMGGQFWSVYVPCAMEDRDAVRATMEQIDVVYKMIARYPNSLQLALSAADVTKAFNAGKLASMIGIEGGHSIDSSLGALRMFYSLGARYMTLTHACNTPWAQSCGDNSTITFRGLTNFGQSVVREMNRIGMIVDLAHVSNVTMHAALNTTLAPVMFSHSGAQAICNVPRNVPDDVLRRLPANGGVVMVNFYNAFVSCNENAATISQVADHIDHIRAVAGIAHIGYGSDFDGVTHYLPQNLTNVSEFPNLTAELIRRGYSDSDVIAILGGNILRVFQRVGDIAQQLQAGTFNGAAGVVPADPPIPVGPAPPNEPVMWYEVPGGCRTFGVGGK